MFAEDSPLFRFDLFHHRLVERSQSLIRLDGVEADVVVSDLAVGIDDDPQRQFRSQLAWVAERVGRAGEIRELAHGLEESNQWFRAARLALDGDFSRSAHVLQQIGSLPEEAYARLRAAEVLVREGRRAEADEQLQRALGFYRSVGATRYVHEAEALLAATA